jgi:Na+/proline symporter
LSLFAVFFVISGYNPNEGIMGTLVKTTFSGLVVLCPTTIAALYWRRANKYGCIASIIIGELSIVFFYYNIIPSFGFLPGILALLISTIVLVFFSYLTSKNK